MYKTHLTVMRKEAKKKVESKHWKGEKNEKKERKISIQFTGKPSQIDNVIQVLLKQLSKNETCKSHSLKSISFPEDLASGSSTI